MVLVAANPWVYWIEQGCILMLMSLTLHLWEEDQTIFFFITIKKSCMGSEKSFYQQNFIFGNTVNVCLNYWEWDAPLHRSPASQTQSRRSARYRVYSWSEPWPCSTVWTTPNLFTVQSLQLDSSSQTKAAHRGSQEPDALHWSVSHSCRFR